MDFREELKKIWDKYERLVPIWDRKQNDDMCREIYDLIKARPLEAHCYPHPRVREWVRQVDETDTLYINYLYELEPQ